MAPICVSQINRICISAPVYFLRKEFWFVMPYFLSLLMTILQAQSGLRSGNFTCPVRVLQVSDIGLVLFFEDWFIKNVRLSDKSDEFQQHWNVKHLLFIYIHDYLGISKEFLSSKSLYICESFNTVNHLLFAAFKFRNSFTRYRFAAICIRERPYL